MHIKFFLEELSAEVALKHILPKILSPDVICIFHAFEGKDDMLKELPKFMKGHQWVPNDWRLIVLIDEDRRDCHELKARLEKAAHDAGFVTKSTAAPDEDYQVVNRLVLSQHTIVGRDSEIAPTEVLCIVCIVGGNSDSRLLFRPINKHVTKH